ncbi:MAG: hypothetical protein E7172_04950 [Firmicutes bacterium]|nr:hypothetical protein [Bacillota bacterium]
MKKFIVSLVMLFSIFVHNVRAEIELPKVTDHEKIKIYLFRSNSCGFCHNFLDYFEEEAPKFADYFEIVSYEVSADVANSALKSAVDEVIGNEETGVPLIVIGDYYKLGFGESSAEEIINEALDAYKDKKYKDVVAKVIKDEELANNPETLEEALINEQNYRNQNSSSNSSTVDDYQTSSSSKDGLIIGGIFLGVIGLFALLMFFSKDN